MHPSTSAEALSFRFPSHDLRVVWRDQEPWFVAADVCTALDIQNPSQALQRLDDEEKALCSTSGLAGNGVQEINVINESGLYSLILGSRKPEAKRFKRWVTSEVLPSLRRTGRYELGTAPEHGNLIASQNQAALPATLADAKVARLQDQLIQAQAAQLRLHQKLGAVRQRLSTREAVQTVIDMERACAPRELIAARTGKTYNHIRQILYKARAAGLLPPAAVAAGAAHAVSNAAQGTLPLEPGAGSTNHG